MIFLWLLGVSLVLGGLAGLLYAAKERLPGLGFRLARVPVQVRRCGRRARRGPAPGGGERVPAPGLPPRIGPTKSSEL